MKCPPRPERAPRATAGRPGPPKPFFWRFKVDQEHHRLVPFGAVGGSPTLGTRRVKTTRATGARLLPTESSRSPLDYDVCPRSVLPELRAPRASRRDNFFRHRFSHRGPKSLAWTRAVGPPAGLSTLSPGYGCDVHRCICARARTHTHTHRHTDTQHTHTQRHIYIFFCFLFSLIFHLFFTYFFLIFFLSFFLLFCLHFQVSIIFYKLFGNFS